MIAAQITEATKNTLRVSAMRRTIFVTHHLNSEGHTKESASLPPVWSSAPDDGLDRRRVELACSAKKVKRRRPRFYTRVPAATSEVVARRIQRSQILPPKAVVEQRDAAPNYQSDRCDDDEAQSQCCHMLSALENNSSAVISAGRWPRSATR